MPQSTSTDGVSVDIYCFATFIVLCSSPLHPKISMLILHTVLYTFPSCRQGEFVLQLRTSLGGDHFLYLWPSYCNHALLYICCYLLQCSEAFIDTVYHVDILYNYWKKFCKIFSKLFASSLLQASSSSQPTETADVSSTHPLQLCNGKTMCISWIKKCEWWINNSGFELVWGYNGPSPQ